MGTSFGLFGTLVTVDEPANQPDAIRDALEARGISTPPDWETAFGETHFEVPETAEVPITAHVCATLRSRDVPHDGHEVREAVVAALDPPVEVQDGAEMVLEAARSRGPIALCTNCRMPEIVGRVLVRAGLPLETFDVCVTSSGCGWRKPQPEIFAITADRLGVKSANLLHVGADPSQDRGVEGVGGRAIVLEDRPLREIGDELR